MPLFGPSGGGGVTSVGLSSAGVLYSVSGSPITSSGTLALNLLSQTANTVLAGPTSGGAATPTMRVLVAADIGAVNPSALTGSGTVPSAGLPAATTSALGAVIVPVSGNLSVDGSGNLSVGAQVPLLNANNSFATAGSAASSGTPLLFGVAPTLTQSGTAGYTGLDVNVTETSTGSGTRRLLDLRVGGTSKFSVDRTGAVTATATAGFNTFSLLRATSLVDSPSFTNQSTLTGVVATGQYANAPVLVAKGVASQTSDLFVCQNSAGAAQFGVMNSGSGGSPVWALRVRATANAESMCVAHSPGAATGRCIQVFDDAGSSLGYLALYA